MGFISTCFSLMVGTVGGIYIAQNYNVPNIRTLANTGLVVAKYYEHTHRKPDAKTEGNSS